jgi:1-acyl-sn-glycerol-3-phosphate acyltransferase
MAVFRFILLVLVLACFLLAVVPLQWVALRLRWPLERVIPILFFRAIVGLLRLRIKTHGASASVRPRLVVSNHVSWTDIIVLGSLEPLCFLSKKEVGEWPLISSFAKLQQTVFIDRKRRRTIPQVNATMAERMLAGRSMMLFPEGTTHDGRKLGKFHSSHFAAARELLAKAGEVETVAVQPVAIRYSSASAAWVGEASLLPHIWALLNGTPLTCDLVFGEPLTYGRETDRKIVARQASSTIESMIARVAEAPLAGPASLVPEPVEALAG